MSKTRNVRPSLRTAVIVGAVLLVFTAVLPAADHDLILLGLSASPNPLERGCSASLSANILINGITDHTLTSGSAAEIRFYWANSASPMPDPTATSGWTLAATLPVTWSSSDGLFAAGREWPTEFPSMAGAAVSWTVPESATTFYLRAEVIYTATGVSDGFGGNNYMTATVSSVEGDCPSVYDCLPFREWMVCLQPDWDIYRIPPDIIRCLIDPDCPPRIVGPLCVICPKCCLKYEYDPWEFPWEILVGYPEEVMRLELLFKDEVVAVSENLDKPIRQGDQVFYQVMRLKEIPNERLSYGLQVVAGPKAEQGTAIPLILDRLPAGMKAH